MTFAGSPEETGGEGGDEEPPCFIYEKFRKVYDFSNGTVSNFQELYPGNNNQDGYLDIPHDPNNPDDDDWLPFLNEHGVSFSQLGAQVPSFTYDAEGGYLEALRIAEQSEQNAVMFTVDTAQIAEFSGIQAEDWFVIYGGLSWDLLHKAGEDRTFMAYTVSADGENPEGESQESQGGTLGIPIITYTKEGLPLENFDEPVQGEVKLFGKGEIDEDGYVYTNAPDMLQPKIHTVFQNQGVSIGEAAQLAGDDYSNYRPIGRTHYLEIGPCMPEPEPICGNGIAETNSYGLLSEECDCGWCPLKPEEGEDDSAYQEWLTGMLLERLDSLGDQEEVDRVTQEIENECEVIRANAAKNPYCWSIVYWSDLQFSDWIEGGQFLHNDDQHWCSSTCNNNWCGDGVLQSAVLGETCEIGDGGPPLYPADEIVEDPWLIEAAEGSEDDIWWAELIWEWVHFWDDQKFCVQTEAVPIYFEGTEAWRIDYCREGKGTYAENPEDPDDPGEKDPKQKCGDDKTDDCCGNGILEQGEECDCGIDQSWIDRITDPTVRIAWQQRCGGGVLNEDCTPDDQCRSSNDCNGEQVCSGCICHEKFNSGRPNNICRPGCTFSKCGDGITDFLFGEVCDHGGNNIREGTPQAASTEELGRVCYEKYIGDGITQCLPYECGDGNVDKLNGEQCDEGDQVNGTEDSNCTETCLSKSFLEAQNSLLDRFFAALDILVALFHAGLQWVWSAINGAWNFATGLL